jgi:hypothetical protein
MEQKPKLLLTIQIETSKGNRSLEYIFGYIDGHNINNNDDMFKEYLKIYQRFLK